MTNYSPPPETDNLEGCLEAVLFVSSAPVSVEMLASLLNRSPAEVQLGLQHLQESYSQGHGLWLQFHHDRVQLTTAAIMSPVVEKFLGLDTTTHLSRAALETLSIIAYRQPITRPEIDFIRGVSSDAVLKSLLSKGLLEEVGRAEKPGRPILYGTTPDFLRHFGLPSLSSLPPYDNEDPEEPAGQRLLKD